MKLHRWETTGGRVFSLIACGWSFGFLLFGMSELEYSFYVTILTIGQGVFFGVFCFILGRYNEV